MLTRAMIEVAFSGWIFLNDEDPSPTQNRRDGILVIIVLQYGFSNA